MSYRTSLPLHPTEDDKPKKKKRIKRVVKDKGGTIAELERRGTFPPPKKKGIDKAILPKETVRKIERGTKGQTSISGTKGLDPYRTTKERGKTKVKVVEKRSSSGETLKYKEKIKVRGVKSYKRKPSVVRGKFKTRRN